MTGESNFCTGNKEPKSCHVHNQAMEHCPKPYNIDYDDSRREIEYKGTEKDR